MHSLDLLIESLGKKRDRGRRNQPIHGRGRGAQEQTPSQPIVTLGWSLGGPLTTNVDTSCINVQWLALAGARKG